MSVKNGTPTDDGPRIDAPDVAVTASTDLDLSDVEACAAMLARSVRDEECTDDCEDTPDASAWLTRGSRGTRLSVHVEATCPDCGEKRYVLTGAPVTADFAFEVDA